jgi:hypothetical protein
MNDIEARSKQTGDTDVQKVHQHLFPNGQFGFMHNDDYKE